MEIQHLKNLIHNLESNEIDLFNFIGRLFTIVEDLKKEYKLCKSCHQVKMSKEYYYAETSRDKLQVRCNLVKKKCLKDIELND